MKNQILIIFIFLFMFIGITLGQSVWFARPSNGEVIAVYGYSETNIPVNVLINNTNTPYPPRIVIGEKIKLVTGSHTYDSSNEEIPQWFYLTPGTYTWRAELW